MMTDCEIRNRSGERIDHTFHPGTRADALVILAHGVTGNKDRPHLVALAEGLSALGWPCLRISYSGNGGSEGRFQDSCITREIGDLQAVLDAVPDTARAAYVGHSMGGAVGVLTAARDLRIQALISLAGMTHTADFVRREFGDVTPGEGFMWEDENCPLSSTYVDDLRLIGNTLSAAEAVTQPWLLIHGDADDLVPIQDGRDAFEAAICEKEFLAIPGAGHSFDEESYPQLVEAVDGWLKASFG
ncbi:MAG: alpha/beta fold hydrolase [Luteolibacter sp.]|uniref:alpha/beta hydrolase n=1 Tax=Luteolibacter sp. TaxID=1962973 RepID=UPI0032657814